MAAAPNIRRGISPLVHSCTSQPLLLTLDGVYLLSAARCCCTASALHHRFPPLRRAGSGQTGDGRVNIDILGISKLKWTGMGEFNSDDHYIYYCGQDPLEDME